MKTLRELVAEARAKKVAIGHFNISNTEALWAIFGAAKSLKVPVIIGTSEGERDFIGTRQAAALVTSLRDEFNFPIFLNADHTYSVEKVKEAIDAGYDAVIFDGAKLPLEENIKQTRECVEYARTRAKETGRDILVEGELGYIGQSSKILDKIPEGVELGEDALTKKEDALRFLKETGIDLIAPAVGNIHGMLRSGADPKLNIKKIAELSGAVSVPLVLHGGSGNSPEDFLAAIDAGVSIVHINTELRVAYRDALKKSLQDNPDEVAPYKILKPARVAMEKVVEVKLRLFNKM